MRTTDLVHAASRNVFRSRLRTTLTVLALVVGAFTLTLTQALGSGVNRYLSDQVASLGAADLLIVSKQEPRSAGDAPRAYDPDTEVAGSTPGSTFLTLDDADLARVEATDGVRSVLPVRVHQIDSITGPSNEAYEFAWGPTASATEPPMVAGRSVDNDSSGAEVLLPMSYVTALGWDDAASALGASVRLGFTDAAGEERQATGVVVGVAEKTLFATGIGINETLSRTVAELQATGAPATEPARYVQAVARFDARLDDSGIAEIKQHLVDLGYTAATVDDQMGAFRSVVDVIVAVLSGFAAVALLAAGFGIVNTLLMSVQERTREIGLMKALGMRNSRVFALFSLEAVGIGVLGAAIGAALAIAAGTLLNGGLAGGLLADLPGLTLLAFEPIGVAVVIAVVAALALTAGTLPAARAARQHPITALRYE